VTKYKNLNNQPLNVVLAEFRFSQVMQIENYIPSLQEALRKKYPISNQRKEQTVFVQPEGLLSLSLDRWSFMSADKKNAIDINQDRLMFYTSDYHRFENFTSYCKDALDALIEIVEPSLILRVGLRYSNLVKIGESEEPTDLIDSHFSFPTNINDLGQARKQQNELLLSTTSGVLLIRTLYGVHSLSCLPDLQGLAITLSNDQEPSKRIILDFDHFWEASEKPVSFESGKIMETLESLHEISREAFWKITTDYARSEKWS
jgi:uncharacterized protein (TIGR04255 family)